MEGEDFVAPLPPVIQSSEPCIGVSTCGFACKSFRSSKGPGRVDGIREARQIDPTAQATVEAGLVHSMRLPMCSRLYSSEYQA